MSSKKIARLIYADSQMCSDMLYWSGLFVPDPFIAFEVNRKKIGIFKALEFTRAKSVSKFDEILPYEEWESRAKKAFRKKWAESADIIRLIAKEYGIGTFRVPDHFPAGLAFKLKSSRLKIDIVSAPFFPERMIKTKEEVRALTVANAASAAGYRVAEAVLKKSTTKKGKLFYEGKVLTSEILRYHIGCACLETGGQSGTVIVAGGDQACDPHCVGFGPLRPNEFIILDIFPRMMATGFYGDMTRTFLKGKASEAQKRQMATVQEAQKIALRGIRDGVSGKKLHTIVVKFYIKQGYETRCIDGVWSGYFHGLGHGLGLDVHEPVRMGVVGHRLKSGMVITVEPGLYYPGIGGCRVEDVVVVKKSGYDMISKYHYKWQIK